MRIGKPVGPACGIELQRFEPTRRRQRLAVHVSVKPARARALAALETEQQKSVEEAAILQSFTVPEPIHAVFPHRRNLYFPFAARVSPIL